MTRRRPSFDATLRSAALIEPMTRTQLGSIILQHGIASEAFARRRLAHVDRMVAITTGRRDANQVRRARELELRRELAPNRAVPGRADPFVHWHGPDRVGGARPVVVLVNGWTASGLVWPGSLLERLGATHDVVRIDNRGAGYSRTAPAPFTVADMADDVARVLDAVGARAATVVGLSMGGMIAQELALRHPARVERLVLCGTRPPAPAAILPARSVIDAVMATPQSGEDLRAFVERAWSAVAGSTFLSGDRAVVAELVDRIVERPTPRSGVVTQMRAIASWYGARRLAQLDVPTVVVHGTDDRLVPVGNGMRLAQLIPGASYVELSSVGHLVPFEAPDAVVAATVPDRAAGRPNGHISR